MRLHSSVSSQFWVANFLSLIILELQSFTTAAGLLNQHPCACVQTTVTRTRDWHWGFASVAKNQCFVRT
jgi:hypothetical protein